MSTRKDPFGSLPDGRQVELYTVTNSHGVEARLTTYGAILVSLKTPDRSGKSAIITLGHDSLAGYLAGHPYFGSTIGRFGNRIAGAKFTLDGREYSLFANDGPNHLHGGKVGFDKVLWQAQPVNHAGAEGVRFSYVSPDGEEGYPGNLTVDVTYILSEQDELRIDYRAQTDKATPVNLTHHSYFNLAGAGSGDIYGHLLTIHADRYLPVNERLIPTGELLTVAGTPMDFRQPMPIGSRIAQTGGGYDHCYVLNRNGPGLSPAARVVEPGSGRAMEIFTTEPAIQFYSGNFLTGAKGAGGAAFHKQHAFCLETEHYPDSPNQPAFPSTILRPGQTYTHTTVHRFSTVPK